MRGHSRTLASSCHGESSGEGFHNRAGRSAGTRCEQRSLSDDNMSIQKQKYGGKAGSGFVVQMPRKSNPRREYRLMQRERIEASPLMAEKFPRLKALRVTLEFFDAAGSTKQGEMKCKLNVALAKSALWFGCPGVECICGDFDLSEALAKAVAGRRKVAAGELRCQGRRKRGDREPVACGTLLRYKLNLNYD